MKYFEKAHLLNDQGGIESSVPGIGVSGTMLVLELGVSPERWREWHERFGYDSQGMGHNGERLLPEFPVIGRLMDTLIDVVILSPEECEVLSQECDRAAERSLSDEARVMFGQLKGIATTAARTGKSLWVGGC